jgi:hypothetical protein
MSSITCGSCRGTHSSVVEVKNCYNLSKNIKGWNSDRVPQGERVYLSVPYSDKERAKGYGANWDRDKKEWWIHRDNFDEFSSELEHWMKQPDKVPALTPPAETTWTSETLPSGNYAVQNEQNEWRFYRVNWGRPDGRWAGRIFLEAQASDEMHEIRKSDVKNSILEKIAANPKEAAIEYGRQIGRCSICNRTLTDENSIAAGIGPICAGKRGWQ